MSTWTNVDATVTRMFFHEVELKDMASLLPRNWLFWSSGGRDSLVRCQIQKELS